ncbi:MAG: dihydroorotate dehydrogenase electron transfer subunit [Chloroflexi bacterium B3_Chlor]|nr:MAG: dihydroorotate dehydrogenase electron transfer subunit [Chloroflexi bacterium B3_Chlor]
MLPRPMRIAQITQEAIRVKTFTLAGELVADPGQFVMVWLPRVDEKPFSLVSDDPLTLTVAKVGPFSARLHELKVGDRLWIRGPLGRGFNIAGQRPLLVGGGYGVAPLAFLASRATEVSHKVAVVGAATKDDLFFEARLAASGCEVVVVTEDCSAGEGGLCTDVAEALLTEQHFDGVYACGPEAMLDKAEELCRQHGIPGQLSKEAHMRCGMGVCGSCQRDGLLVCRDGPVFDLEPETSQSASQS